MNQVQEFINADLYNVNENEFSKNVSNDFIGDNFIDQLEWSMLIIQQKFQQIRSGNHVKIASRNSFDKAFLMSGKDSLNDNMKFFKPLTDLQATPDIFPFINIKTLIISDTITLRKMKEMRPEEKRNLKSDRQYVIEESMAYYMKNKESFYAITRGLEFNKGLFNLGGLDVNNIDVDLLNKSLPRHISLIPGYYYENNSIFKMSKEDGKKELVERIEIATTIAMAYNIAMSMYYEWSIYIKEYDNIGFTIPISPIILKEIFSTSMLKFDSKKRMLHFVRDHYRRKVALPTEDYTIYVNKSLRGEHKFNYNGFSAEIIPPKYDLNRVKTKKKFVDYAE